MNPITSFSFEILGEQYFSKESKYVVEIKPQFSKLLFVINDKQFSELLVMFELFYEWWLNIMKNGQKEFSYPENIE